MNHLSDESLRGIIDVPAAAREDLRTSKERDAFSRFKVKFSSSEWGGTFVDDVTLLRFLAADGFDVDLGMKRLLEALVWRKERGVDSLLSCPPPKLKQYRAIRVRRWLGEDKEGRPVMFERLGEFMASGPGVNEPFTLDEWVDCYSWDVELHFVKMMESAKRRGIPVRWFVFVADCGGMQWSKLASSGIVPLLKLCTKAVERHYPELVARIMLLNTPRIAVWLYNRLIKHFMDPVTANKVEMFSGVPTERLLEVIPAEVLPVELGGTNTTAALPHVVPWREWKDEGGDDDEEGFVTADEED